MNRLIIILSAILIAIIPIRAQIRSIEGLINTRLNITWFQEDASIDAYYKDGVKAIIVNGDASLWKDVYLCGTPPAKCYHLSQLLEVLKAD